MRTTVVSVFPSEEHGGRLPDLVALRIPRTHLTLQASEFARDIGSEALAAPPMVGGRIEAS